MSGTNGEARAWVAGVIIVHDSGVYGHWTLYAGIGLSMRRRRRIFVLLIYQHALACLVFPLPLCTVYRELTFRNPYYNIYIYYTLHVHATCSRPLPHLAPSRGAILCDTAGVELVYEGVWLYIS